MTSSLPLCLTPAVKSAPTPSSLPCPTPPSLRCSLMKRCARVPSSETSLCSKPPHHRRPSLVRPRSHNRTIHHSARYHHAMDFQQNCPVRRLKRRRQGFRQRPVPTTGG